MNLYMTKRIKKKSFFYVIIILFWRRGKRKLLDSLAFILYYLSVDRSNDKWSNQTIYWQKLKCEKKIEEDDGNISLTWSGSTCSTNLSNVGIHDGDKWQFWKNTHCPFSIADLIIDSALGPYEIKSTVCKKFFLVFTCPWPSDIVLRRLANFISSANLYKSAAGSVPTDRTKINGVIADESRKTRCKSAVYKTDY